MSRGCAASCSCSASRASPPRAGRRFRPLPSPRRGCGAPPCCRCRSAARRAARVAGACCAPFGFLTCASVHDTTFRSSTVHVAAVLTGGLVQHLLEELVGRSLEFTNGGHLGDDDEGGIARALTSRASRFGPPATVQSVGNVKPSVTAPPLALTSSSRIWPDLKTATRPGWRAHAGGRAHLDERVQRAAGARRQAAEHVGENVYSDYAPRDRPRCRASARRRERRERAGERWMSASRTSRSARSRRDGRRSGGVPVGEPMRAGAIHRPMARGDRPVGPPRRKARRAPCVFKLYRVETDGRAGDARVHRAAQRRADPVAHSA